MEYSFEDSTSPTSDAVVFVPRLETGHADVAVRFLVIIFDSPWKLRSSSHLPEAYNFFWNDRLIDRLID